MDNTSEPVAGGCWRKKSGREWHWRDWDGGSVVFELRSGHTYQLAPLPAAVMAYFETREHSFEEIVRVIAADLGAAPDEDLCAALNDSIQQLIKLGWIEPIIAA